MSTSCPAQTRSSWRSWVPNFTCDPLVPNLTNITPQRVPLVDPATSTITREWYRFLFSLFETVQNTSSFTSTLQTLPAGNGTVTVSHNGPRAPTVFSVVARRNSTAAPGGTVDASYAAGDEVQINGPDAIAANTAYSVWSNATQLGYAQSTNPPSVTFKGGGNNGNISGTYWGLIFYCIWL